MIYIDELLTSSAPNSDCSDIGPDPSAEEKFWRDNYEHEPYCRKDRDFVDYGPAFRVGYEGRCRYAGTSFEEAEVRLRNDYERIRGSSLLNWDTARAAALAAWKRVERKLGNGADGHGR